MVTESFRKYLEEAIGSGNALVAFSAFDSPASRTEHVRKAVKCRGAVTDAYCLNVRSSLLTRISMQVHIMSRIHLPCLSDMRSENCSDPWMFLSEDL